MYVKAFAKINVYLDVLGKREDGYHELDMVMLPIELHDSIEFSRCPDEYDTFITCDHVELTKSKYNLISKTYKLMKERYNLKGSFKITVHKEIPISAGLGGGSSNAAATIHALNSIYKLKLSMEEMCELGKEIVCDVPFCLLNKPARVKGVGELITPIKLKHQYDVIIIKPDEGLSTQRVFELSDSMTLDHGDGDKVEKAITEGDDAELAKVMFNALEKPAIQTVNEVQKVKDMMKNDGFDMVLMSGSGSSVYALTTNHKLAHQLFKKYDKAGYDVYLTKTF